MTHCTASISYDEGSMKEMVRVRMRTFRGIGSYGIFMIGLIFIIVGVLTSYGTLATRTAMVAIGCFMVVGVNTPEKYMGKKIVQSMNGRFPKLQYDFNFSNIKVKGADTISRVGYHEIIRLVEEENYLYLFLENKSAFMVDKKTVKPKVDNLKELLSEKVGLPWMKARPIFGLSLASLIMFFKYRKALKDRKNKPET